MSLRNLKGLINQIASPALKECFDVWLKENVVEFGMYIDVSAEAIHNYPSKEVREDIERFQVRKVVHEIGMKMIAECGSIEKYDTPFSERTVYRIFGIKHLGD